MSPNTVCIIWIRCTHLGVNTRLFLFLPCDVSPINIYLLLSFLQILCFASGTKETAHIAKLVARQRSSKKTGRPNLVNTQMRVKPAAPLVLNGKILEH